MIYKRTTDASYVCSLSKLVREGVERTGTDLRPVVEGLVDQFENDPELSASLKVHPPEPGTKVVRQVDLRPAKGGAILLKVFMSWDMDKTAWHVCIEGPSESVFENGERNF